MPHSNTARELAPVRCHELFTDFLARAREWQKRHPEWQLLCDMGDTAPLYETFGELPKSVRMVWVGKYREAAVEMWKEYGMPRCKVPKAILNDRLELVDEWPMGHAMTVFMVNPANLARESASVDQHSIVGRPDDLTK